MPKAATAPAYLIWKLVGNDMTSMRGDIVNRVLRLPKPADAAEAEVMAAAPTEGEKHD